LIYTHKITNRVRYIFQLLLQDQLGLEYKVTLKKGEFKSYSGPKFSYTSQPLDDELFIAASELLFERGIEGHALSFINFEENKAFFPSVNRASAFPFDPFAASFYLVSRYEEYLPYVKDKYSRFEASKSTAHDKGFLQKPLVNIWALKLGEVLKKHFRGLQIRERRFKFQPTIDINAAWVFQSKGLVRSVGGYLKTLPRFDVKDMWYRTRVLTKIVSDPYDTYRLQLTLHNKYELRPIYFVLFADYGQNDKNIHVNNRNYQILIKSLADYADVGIHSSFGSTFEHWRLKTEIDRLSDVLKREILKCRQHFLRLNIPLTYRNLINMGIREDYSMGFSAQQGFRAGIADPFYFYDLDLDAPTKLRVHPFAFSETVGTEGSDEERMKNIAEVIREVKAVNGTLTGAWDNASLSGYHRRGNWMSLYEKIIKFALE